jgi:hypothetical protein
MKADTRATFLLCLACAAITTFGWIGLSRGGETTLSVLRSIPVHKSDWGEDLSLRETRLAELADSIDANASTIEERAMLIAIGKHESGFAEEVCAGEKLGDKGRAFGCWQSHDKDRGGGVTGQAQRAVRDIRRARNYCQTRGHHPIKGALSLYGTGRVCTHQFPLRWATYERIVGRL